MKRITNAVASAWRRFLGDRRGVSTVEYALIVVAIIAIVGVVAAQMNEAFTGLFGDLAEGMGDAADDVTGAADDAPAD